MFKFFDLRHFARFDHVVQWIENEQKTLIRQMIVVLTFLLITRKSTAMHYMRIICDFITMIQYRSHDENTFQYMKQTMYKIDKLKWMFKTYRLKNTNDKSHFNIFKMHMITHYFECIRKFESTNKFDRSHNETTHKYLMKIFYVKINKRNKWLKQILFHNIRHVNMQIMNDFFVHQQSSLII